MLRTLVGMILATAALSVAACGNGTPDEPLSDQKKQLLQGQHNGIDQCTQLGLPVGCDLCAELGFYGDGICDNALILHGLCVGPDPDCVASELVCDDGTDDDWDGLVDCADPDCDYTPACWPTAVCGNGIVEAAEECDDGNGVAGDGCDAACRLETTPDPEVCDDGIDNDLDGTVDCADADCATHPGCAAPTCGNGIVEAGEQCDDGNNVNGDGCSNACLVETGESHCWDRMDNDGDGLIDCADPDCSTDPVCTATCGDGVVEGLEECDDGNSQSGDGCSAYCTWEVSAELCNDGIDNDLDGAVDCADSDCFGNPACGSATCGNGIVEAGEQCDDGNSQNGDGCNNYCLLEEHAVSCTDGIDNDRDGLVDCADPDCANDPGCP